MMRKLLISLSLLTLFAVCACHDDDPEEENKTADKALVLYIPFSGTTSSSYATSSIYAAFLKNIAGIKTAVEYQGGLGSKRIVVIIANSTKSANIIEIKYQNGKCVNDTLKKYTLLNSTSFSTAEGISAFFKDVKAAVPANKYNLLVSTHGMGWQPAGTERPRATKSRKIKRLASEMANEPESRYFGAPYDADYQGDIAMLSQAIANSFGHVDFVLFDDCYMSNIETAYELKNVADYMIASTCEVHIDGMPFATVGSYILNENYAQLVDTYYNYYSKDPIWNPYGCTIAVTKLSELDATAAIMKQINTLYADTEYNIDDIQILDLYNPTVFFDLGSYAKVICKDETLLNQLNQQLKKLVPYTKNTTYFHAYNIGSGEIKDFCGLTVSDPSVSNNISEVKKKTTWWAATH